ncbi:MAG: cytochrome c oxidase assembly protein, partial [Propioniciclava sp.]
MSTPEAPGTAAAEQSEQADRAEATPSAPRVSPPWPGTGGLLAVSGAVGLATAFVVLVGLDLGTRPPLPARIQAVPITGLVSLIGDLAARLAAFTTLGALAAALLERAQHDGRTSPSGAPYLRIAGRAAQVWLWASLLNTIANTAYVNGVPMAVITTPATWLTFLGATGSMIAWTGSAVVAAVIVVAAYRTRSRAALVLCFAAGVAAQLFVVVTGNVTIGLDHDWATDAAIIATLALLPAAALVLGVWLRGLQPDTTPAGESSAGATDGTDELIGSRVQLASRMLLPAAGLALAGHAAVAWQQLAGEPAASQAYGQVSIALLVALAILGALAGWRLIARLARRPVLALRSLSVDIVVLILFLALLSAENHLPSPRFLVPQNTEINYLGYIVSLPPTLERILGLARPNVLWITIVVAAVTAYVAGMVRVRHRGGRWPVARLISWVASWFLVAFIAMSGLWEYSTVMYSWHMVVHMTVNMLVPVLAVLGAPVGLIRAATDPEAVPTSLGTLATSIEQNRGWQLLTSPPVAWLTYVGSLFAVYFTPVFPWLMRYHWAHQLMLLFFMATGYFFFSLIVGIDHTTRSIPHLIKLALVISIMPFHAVFAVGILSSRSLIGGEFYQALAIPWMTDLMADQNIAGQATWILGEVPLFIVLIALAFQWFRSDSRDAQQ